MQAGANSIEIASTSAAGTSEAIFTVTDLFVPGTVVLSAAPAPGEGSDPGTYAYPTATNSDGSPTFAPDSFRLGGFTVISSGSTVTFQVQVANLQPTLGSLLGAQLIDIYIHAPSGSVPAGELLSTAAAGAFNYSIAPADAWNQLIEVDGFGTDDWVTPTPPAVCTYSPAHVPFVLDTIPPADVNVQTEARLVSQAVLDILSISTD